MLFQLFSEPLAEPRSFFPPNTSQQLQHEIRLWVKQCYQEYLYEISWIEAISPYVYAELANISIDEESIYSVERATNTREDMLYIIQFSDLLLKVIYQVYYSPGPNSLEDFDQPGLLLLEGWLKLRNSNREYLLEFMQQIETIIENQDKIPNYKQLLRGAFMLEGGWDLENLKWLAMVDVASQGWKDSRDNPMPTSPKPFVKTGSLSRMNAEPAAES